jgi:hypothetical protein
LVRRTTLIPPQLCKLIEISSVGNPCCPDLRQRQYQYVRLKEFRRAVTDLTLEFIPIASPKGRQILDELAKDAPELLNRIYQQAN